MGKTLEEKKEELMENPEFKTEFLALEEDMQLAKSLIEARARAGMTQEEVAKRAGTSQPAIARMESGTINSSVRTLTAFAKAVGTKLVIKFEPAQKDSKGLSVAQLSERLRLVDARAEYALIAAKLAIQYSTGHHDAINAARIEFKEAKQAYEKVLHSLSPETVEDMLNELNEYQSTVDSQASTET